MYCKLCIKVNSYFLGCLFLHQLILIPKVKVSQTKIVQDFVFDVIKDVAWPWLYSEMVHLSDVKIIRFLISASFPGAVAGRDSGMRMRARTGVSETGSHVPFY